MSQRNVKNQTIIIGGIISTILLVIFLLMQYYDFKGLALDVKWIAVCGIPILISVFISGFVKSFKGFGVELEANLSEPFNLEFLRPVETIETYGFQKASMEFLNNLQPHEKRRAQKLTFILGRRNYYDIFAVEAYFRQLQNLQFIEITSEQGILKYLLNAGQFYRREERSRIPREDKISVLLKSLESDDILSQFPDAISKRIKKGDSIIDAYSEFEATTQGKMYINRNQVLPVVDNSEKMIGLIDRRTLEELICKDVLKSIRK
jgi:hypothetical protein